MLWEYLQSELSRWPIYQSVTLSFFRRKKLAQGRLSEQKTGNICKENFLKSVDFDEKNIKNICGDSVVTFWGRVVLYFIEVLPAPVWPPWPSCRSLTFTGGQEAGSVSVSVSVWPDDIEYPSEKISGKLGDIYSTQYHLRLAGHPM